MKTYWAIIMEQESGYEHGTSIEGLLVADTWEEAANALEKHLQNTGITGYKKNSRNFFTITDDYGIDVTWYVKPVSIVNQKG